MAASVYICKGYSLRMLHFKKNQKPNNPVHLLISRCNTSIENLTQYMESRCEQLTKTIPCCTEDTAHLLDVIDDTKTYNKRHISSDHILVLLDIVSMFPNIGNIIVIQAFLPFQTQEKPKTIYRIYS